MTDPSLTRPDEPCSSFGDTVRDGAVPEAELAAAVRARPTGPRRAGTGRAGTGPVRWVRASDAVAELSGATAGRGIDLHRELADRIRGTTGAVPPAVADRLRAVPSAVRGVLPSRPGAQLERTR